MNWPESPLELTGVISTVGAEETVGAKGYKVRKIRVIPDGFSGPLEFEFFGKNIPADIGEVQPGARCRVGFSVAQRDWNGRTFTKLDGIALTEAEEGGEGEKAKGEEEIPF